MACQQAPCVWTYMRMQTLGTRLDGIARLLVLETAMSFEVVDATKQRLRLPQVAREYPEFPSNVDDIGAPHPGGHLRRARGAAYGAPPHVARRSQRLARPAFCRAPPHRAVRGLGAVSRGRCAPDVCSVAVGLDQDASAKTAGLSHLAACRLLLPCNVRSCHLHDFVLAASRLHRMLPACTRRLCCWGCRAVPQ